MQHQRAAASVGDGLVASEPHLKNHKFNVTVLEEQQGEIRTGGGLWLPVLQESGGLELVDLDPNDGARSAVSKADSLAAARDPGGGRTSSDQLICSEQVVSHTNIWDLHTPSVTFKTSAKPKLQKKSFYLPESAQTNLY